jgi:hypothetical protein
MNEPSGTNLDWLAFAYVTRSLSESECEAFEREMLDSQEHREAVARAVELALAADYACRSQAEAEVELAAPSRASRADSRRSAPRIRRWLWSAVAASVAFLIGWQTSLWFLGGDANQPGNGNVAESGSEPQGTLGIAGRELALAWDQTRRAFTSADLDPDSASIAINGDSDLADDPSDAPAASEIEAPSWMLAAVAGMRSATSEASPEDAIRPQPDPTAPSDKREEG